jgi:hypothetical protein
MKKKKKKKTKKLGYELVQAIQASIQNKVNEREEQELCQGE